MKVFSVHETPGFVYEGKYYHPCSNVITKYFQLGDEILYGISNPKSISSAVAKRFEQIEDERICFVILDKINSLQGLISGQDHNRKIIQENVLKSDIIVARLPSFSGELAVKYARKYSKPYMVEVIGCAWDVMWNYSWKGKLIAPLRFLTTRRIVRKAPYALYVTDKFLQRRYPCKGKSVGCSNVAIENAAGEIYDKRLERIKQMSFPGRVNLTTIGAVDILYKGQQYVIQAIAFLNKQGYNFHYTLVGGGEQNYLRDLAKSYGIEENIHFTGAIVHEKVFDVLDNTDIYVHPSKTEGLPRALIEAMNRGCPSIGSDIAGIPELLDESCLFKKGSVNQIIGLLKKIDRQTLLLQAERNFQKAKEYLKPALNQKRKDFFQMFLRDHHLKE